MSSSREQDARSKFFTQSWTVTLPSHPGLKFFRATPPLFDLWLAIVMDPANNELQDTAGKIWDDAAKREWRERSQKRYDDLNTAHNGLDILVELDGKLVGYGDMYESKPGEASVGIILNKDARGKGIGKAGIQVLTQLGFEIGENISTGTMKANAPMRGIMKSLGIEEIENIVEIPRRGVVAEIEWEIERAKWKSIDMKVEFGEPVSSA
jgi:RimJ/RimL family protein N-acetyltransferase